MPVLKLNEKSRISNIFTVDFEDWYQGLEVVNETKWKDYKHRINIGTDILLDLLDQTNNKATFFILACNAKRYHTLIKRINSCGHEIACHGLYHNFIFNLKPNEFRAQIETSKNILEDICGTKVIGYRAPFFSITNKSMWALDILAEVGYEYDSSIFPVMNYRYGIPSFRRDIHKINLNNNKCICEFPISVFRLLGINFPFSGGFYLRFFPAMLIRAIMKKLNNMGTPVIAYIHPWEVDPLHPKIKVPLRIALTHYHNLHNSKEKVKLVLDNFTFLTIRGYINKYKITPLD